MLSRFLIFLCDVSPAARRFLWRWWYEKWARKVESGDWTFMNYGLDLPPGAEPLVLEPGDEPDRYCAQLYHRTALPGNLSGKDVLEVGSGRGGGASFVARYHRPASMTGVDFSPQAVALSNARRQVPGLKFLTGDAEKLPFPDQSFDAVINVESSHCYGSMAAFVREAARVLRPGGFFLISDLREASEMPELETLLASQPALEVMENEDITALVEKSLTLDHSRKQALIATLIPAGQRALFEEFAGLAGSKIHRGLSGRTLLYHRFVLRKKA
ncbi:MAG: class I SAM-dependent methyltransferase [Verrucomicrobiota bacterium]